MVYIYEADSNLHYERLVVKCNNVLTKNAQDAINIWWAVVSSLQQTLDLPKSCRAKTHKKDILINGFCCRNILFYYYSDVRVAALTFSIRYSVNKTRNTICQMKYLTTSFIFSWMKQSVMKDDKWFLEFPSEMIEWESVVIVNMCEVCKCKDC